MIRLMSLEVYISIFNITEGNIHIKVYKILVEKSGGVSNEKVRVEIEKDLNISDITATDLQDVIIGPISIEEFREQVTKTMKNDK